MQKCDDETRVPKPQSCSWLVIRSNQFGPQNPNQTHRHQKPTRRHADRKQFRTWWVESSFVFVLHSSFQFYQLFWSDVEKNAKRFKWRKSHGKIKTDDESGITMQRKDSWRATFYCIRKPGKNQTWKSISSELVNWAASQNRATCWRRLLIKLLGMECW